MAFSPYAPSGNQEIAGLVLTGQARSGKTGIYDRLVFDTFNPDYVPTKQVIFGVKAYPPAEFAKGIKLQIWDTQGDYPYRELIYQHYRSARMVICALDGSRPLAEQRKLLLEDNAFLRSNSQAIRVLAVTKSDLPQQITPEEIQQFKEELGLEQVFAISALQGVHDLDDFIYSRLMRQMQERNLDRVFPHPSHPLPNSELINRKFERALRHLEQGKVMQIQATRRSAAKFYKKLRELKEKILADSRCSMADKVLISDKVCGFSNKVADLNVSENDVKIFKKEMAPYKGSTFNKVLQALLVASLCLVVAAAFLGLGPGGTIAVTVAGVWCTHWLSNRSHALSKLERAGDKVLESAPSPILASR